MNDARKMSQKNNGGTTRAQCHKKTTGEQHTHNVTKKQRGTNTRAHRAGSARLQFAATAEGDVVVGPAHFARQAFSVSLEFDPSLPSGLVSVK